VPIVTGNATDSADRELGFVTGGNLRNNVDHCICVPSNETPQIQECHVLIGHIISELVEREIFREEGRVSGS
jgi:hypothetical protein